MVYLLHFDQKYHHAQHYIGYCAEDGLEARFKRHKRGDGSKLMRAVFKAGIGVTIARTWAFGGYSLEKELKKRKKARMYCPICRREYEK